MVGCAAALSWMAHGVGGAVLNLGRRRRRPNAAIRKAARERDQGRCRYPGCESRRVDLDYAIYTCLANEQLRRDRAAGHDDAEGPAATGYQPGDWYQFVRQSDTGQAAYAPTYLPVQV